MGEGADGSLVEETLEREKTEKHFQHRKGVGWDGAQQKKTAWVAVAYITVDSRCCARAAAFVARVVRGHRLFVLSVALL